ncbi:MAG: hypothetical protein P9L92_11665 [Candidatus Electryonea clarkiae]|nr:hypothetical protein [Candidatus Electryonea clarkiae]MDP8286170.1 hypothetical protein [Candidatus Electryonea clarkiae]
MAKLPVPEKIRILVEMQRIAAPLLKAQGKRALVWDIEESAKSNAKNVNR